MTASDGNILARVTPFEHFMFADDRPSAPKTFFLRFGLSGKLDPDAFKGAISDAQDLHPLTRSVITADAAAPAGQLAWAHRPDLDAPLTISRNGEPFPAYPNGHAYLDIRKEAGIRFFLKQEGHTADLVLQAHHSVCDATGAIEFFGDVLLAYGDRRSGTVRLRAKTDKTYVEGRHDWHTPPDRQAAAGSLRQTLISSAMPIESAARKQPVSAPPPSPVAFPASYRRSLSADQLSTYRKRAISADATVNDVLLHDLFVALNANRTASDEQASIRIAVPVDLRTQDQRPSSAANMVGIAFIDFPNDDGTGAFSLLGSVSRQTRGPLKREKAEGFRQAIGIASQRRNILAHFCQADHCYSTAVLSNLRTPFKDSPLLRPDGRLEAGGLVVETAELLPPLRPMTNAAIGVISYAGRMQVTLHYDPDAIEPADAERLLDDFVPTGIFNAADNAGATTP